MSDALLVLGRVKDLAVQFRDDSYSAGDRATAAREVRQLLAQLRQLSNTSVNGQALFSGTTTRGRATGVAITLPKTITNGTNDTLIVKVDGSTSGTIDLGATATYATGASLAAQVESTINADATLTAAGKAVTVTYDTDHLVITSKATGAASTVEVTGGTAQTILGFSGGSTTAGGDPFALQALAGVDSRNTGGGVITQGKVTDPNAVTMDDYLVKFTSASMFSVYNVSKPVTVTANANNVGGAAVSDRGVNNAALVRGNDYEIRVQNTYTVTGTNNALRFTDPAGTVSNASITAGTYTGSQLASALKTAMEAADSGAYTYTVAYDSATGKFSITNDVGNAASVTLSFDNAATTAEDLLGFSANARTVAAGAATTGNDATSTSGATVQHYVYDSTAGSAVFNVTSANNTLYRGGSAITLTAGSYTGATLAAEIQTQLGAGYTVAYSTAAGRPARFFTITNSSGGAATFNWSNAGATARSLLGYEATDSVVANAGTDVSDFDAGNTTYTSDAAIDFDGLRVALRTASGAPHDGDKFNVGHSMQTVLANQNYVSGSDIAFDGIQAKITTGGSAPAAGDLFRIQTGVQYQGNSATQSVEVGSNQTVKINLAGNAVFTGTTIDLFASVKKLVVALNGDYGGGINQSNADADTSTNQVLNAQGEIGALANRMELTAGSLENYQVILKKALSENEDTDLVTAISELTMQQQALQATMATANKIFETSLLNFLR